MCTEIAKPNDSRRLVRLELEHLVLYRTWPYVALAGSKLLTLFGLGWCAVMTKTTATLSIVGQANFLGRVGAVWVLGRLELMLLGLGVPLYRSGALLSLFTTLSSQPECC